MTDAWSGPIASHGDTEDEVRAAIMDNFGLGASAFRRKLRAERLPLNAIGKAMALLEEMQRAQIEKDLPQIMRNMAITAGAAPPLQ